MSINIKKTFEAQPTNIAQHPDNETYAIILWNAVSYHPLRSMDNAYCSTLAHFFCNYTSDSTCSLITLKALVEVSSAVATCRTFCMREPSPTEVFFWLHGRIHEMQWSRPFFDWWLSPPIVPSWKHFWSKARPSCSFSASTSRLRKAMSECVLAKRISAVSERKNLGLQDSGCYEC